MGTQTLDDEPHGAGPKAAEIAAALERVLRSRCFEHAARASSFLRFVVAKTLAGETDQLKGYTIAIHVFGRSADFDAKSDPLVRVEALRLRQRLTEYYAGEGSGDRVRLELPRGGYALKATYTGAPPSRVRCAALSAPRRRAGPLAALWTRARVAAATAAAAVAAAALLVTFSTAPLQRKDAVAAPGASMPEDADRTTITVVPLQNLGRKATFRRLAAGLTEEIMLRLDDLDLYVIAKHGKWNRPGRVLDGVLRAEHSYVLTGSVRDQSGGAHITLQIIEAETGAQIWTAAYDAPPGIEEEPELQARIARDAAAAAALFGPVFDAELALARRTTLELELELELPDCQTRYRAFREATDPALFPDAFACFQGLVARQPRLGQAWAALAMLYIDEHVYYSGSDDRGAALSRARAAVRTALELDATNVLANAALTRYQYYDGDPDFLRTAERALALEPDNPEMLGLLGILLTAYGDSTHGLELVTRGRALSPQRRGVFNLAHVLAALQDGKPCEALTHAHTLNANKWYIAHMVTAASAGLCGDAAAAAEARGRLLAATPSFEEEAVGLVDLWRFNPPLRDAVLDGLRAAGLALRNDASAERSHAETRIDSVSGRSEPAATSED